MGGNDDDDEDDDDDDDEIHDHEWWRLIWSWRRKYKLKCRLNNKETVRRNQGAIVRLPASLVEMSPWQPYTLSVFNSIISESKSSMYGLFTYIWIHLEGFHVRKSTRPIECTWEIMLGKPGKTMSAWCARDTGCSAISWHLSSGKITHWEYGSMGIPLLGIPTNFSWFVSGESWKGFFQGILPIGYNFRESWREDPQIRKGFLSDPNCCRPLAPILPACSLNTDCEESAEPEMAGKSRKFDWGFTGETQCKIRNWRNIW